MADFNDESPRPAEGLGIPAVTDTPLTPHAVSGAPNATVHNDTGLPFAMEGAEATPGSGPMRVGD